MAKVTADPNPCIRLHKVLEEEYTHLHGELPASYSSSENSQTRLKAIWTAIHALSEKRSAFCVSGGGIRSATFALGVLQGLARCGLLGKFHYLSTVSGGGYIGSWLAAWINRAANGLAGVAEQLGEGRTEARPNPEPQQIQNLRNYSNYLSPKLGLLSADTWTLVATYFRNLVLNWFVFLPLLGAFLMLPWIYTSFVMIDPPPIANAVLWVSAACIILAVVFMAYSLPSGHNGRLGERTFLGLCLLPLVLSAILMTMYWAWIRYYDKTPTLSFLGVASRNPLVTFVCFGVGIHLMGWMLSLLWMHGFVWKEVVGVLVSGAVGGWLLWLAAVKIFPNPLKYAELYCCLAVPLYLALFFFVLTVFVGICSRETRDEDREWWARASGWILIAITVWLVPSALVIFGPSLLSSAYSWTYSILAAGGLSGIVTILAGRSRAIPANLEQEKETGPRAFLFLKVSTIAALVFLAVTVILVTKGTIWIVREIVDAMHYPWPLSQASLLLGKRSEDLNVILYAPLTAVLAVAGGLLLIGLLMAFFVNPNRFSLHAMYRDRLIRAYLGASNTAREPHPFTGFDSNDNIPMHSLWDKQKFGNKLLPMINIALNLVQGRKLAWQERKAASFTVSPLHCGSSDPRVGYRKTAVPRGHCYGGRGGISLGTAVTMSGAAASPNMGYHSSPLVAFILTFLNVRLGAWAGNPADGVGDRTFYLDYPRLAIRPIIAEALGLTNDTNPYVYLSDGGHFENLGLYEMVLRRCHYIVVSDAGQDPKCSFADLGEAVRKVRIDLGVPIEFPDPIYIYSRSDDAARNKMGRNCAIGYIRYSAVDETKVEDDGVLIYIKPACYGHEPRDIYEYFKRSPLFPHESTVDQFFTESQFESYRMLGVYTMQNLCMKPVKDFPDFIGEVRKHLAIETQSPVSNPLPPRTNSGAIRQPFDNEGAT
jgi:patatin-like phospholipase